MTVIPASHLIPAIHIETLEDVLLWDGGGRVANEHGDLYGTSPNRIICWGKAVIGRDRLEGAIAAGWRVVDKAWPDAAAGDALLHEFADLCYIKSSITLEVDHVIPLWRIMEFAPADRQALYGPANLWLLCDDCHTAKSAVEATERAAVKRSTSTI